jgi:hypothetical protein
LEKIGVPVLEPKVVKMYIPHAANQARVDTNLDNPRKNPISASKRQKAEEDHRKKHGKIFETMEGLPRHLRYVYAPEVNSVESAFQIKKTAQKYNQIAVESVKENTLVKLGLKSAEETSEISRKD